MSAATHRPVVIALADDDIVDRKNTRRALGKTGLDNELIEVEDGQELIDLLHLRGKFATASRPDLVLLDLNMPVMDGRQVLELMAAEPELASIPVVVLTGSDEPDDIRRSYLHGVASYISKPVDFAGILRVVQSLDGYSVAIIREV